MNINLTARHTEITPQIREYCTKRIKPLEKMLGQPLEMDVVCSVEKYRNIVEIKVKTRIGIVNSMAETEDMVRSLGEAFDQLEKRLKKEKAKLREKKRRRRKQKETFFSPAREEPRKKIIPSFDFSMKPMSVEEALFQLESDKKEVFLFQREDTGNWSVLHRRKDGHFSLISPE